MDEAAAQFLGHVVGGWQVSGLTAYESGNPYTITNGQDSDGLEGNDRPDFNPLGKPGCRARPDRTSPTGYVNPDAVDAAGNPTPINPQEARFIGLPRNPESEGSGPIGNLGRNTERSPGLKNWDLNVVKRFRFTEGMFLQFRGEFYNVFNTPQYGTVSVSPFRPSQNSQTIPANVTLLGGRCLRERDLRRWRRPRIRWQVRLEF